MPEKIAVIGAGIAGLAVAVRLAAKGYSVSIFEKNDGPGGKISQIRHEGYRFDTGPSLFTLPGLINDLFELAAEDVNSHFLYEKLPLVCRYFYNDGMVINAYADADDFTDELQAKTGEIPGRVRAYLDDSRKIYGITNPVFIENSLHKLSNYFSREFITSMFLVHKIKPFSTLHQVNSKYFRHRNTVQIFDRFATYNGSNPYKTPATLMVISHLEHNTGAYFPVKGMFDITTTLAALCTKMGVTIHYNSKVEEVMIERKKVMGIRHSQDITEDFQAVVSDVDIWHLYKNLLKSVPFPEKWFRHERSTSALIFYWGMETVSTGFDLHNILFSSDYEQEFKSLFNLKTLHEDPTVYIFISSKVVKNDAPPGCENWFVMVNMPENNGQDWDGMIAETRCTIEKKIRRITGIDISKHRKFEFILDPRGIESKTASYRGSLYGNSSNSMWAAFQRHPNFSAIKGLYFTGGSVHPGGGIPLCLSSAKIVAEMFPSLNNQQ